MGWKHQAVLPSGKSYGPTLTQHPKVPKVYPARGGQRFAVVCPAVLTLNETCTCAPSPRGVDQVGAGSSRSCTPLKIHMRSSIFLPSIAMFVQQRVYTYYTLIISEQDDPPSKWIWNMISPSMAPPIRTIYDDIFAIRAITPSYLSLNSLQVPVHSQWRWRDVHPVQRRNHWPLASTAWPMERPAILSGMSGKFNKNDGIGWTNVSNKKRQYGFRPSNQWKWLVDCYSSCAHRWRHKRAPVAHVSEVWTIWFSRTKDVVLDGVGLFQRQNPGMLLVITQHVLVLV